MAFGFLLTAYGLLVSVVGIIVTVSGAQSGMRLEVAEEEQMAKRMDGRYVRKHQTKAACAVRGPGLRTALLDLDPKTNFHVRDS